MKRILIAHNYEKVSFAVMSYQLAHFLANKGYHVIFLSYRPHFADSKEEEFENGGKITVLSWSTLARPTKIKDFRHFYKIYKKYKPNIIIAHFVGSNITAIISKVCSFFKAKVYVYYHTLTGQIYRDKKSNAIKYFLLKFRKKIFYKVFVDALICPSKLAQRDLRENFTISFSKVILNPMTDRKKLQIHENNSKSIAFLGRIDKSKGVIELINAFKEFKKQYPQSKINLKIAGSGTYVDEVKELIHKNIDIEYMGSLPYEKVDDYILDSSFIIIPSLSDNLPTVGLEALMLGKPLLISNSTGLTEYLNDESCFKFNPDVEGIFNILQRIELESYNYSQMCQNARKQYEDLFTIEKYCNTMYDFIINSKSK